MVVISNARLYKGVIYQYRGDETVPILINGVLDMDTNQPGSTALFYNTWGGRYPGAFKQFLEMHTPRLDVLCLTEVTRSDTKILPGYLHTSTRETEAPMSSDSFTTIEGMLGDFTCFFSAGGAEDMACARTKVIYPKIEFGSALCWRQDLIVIESGAEPICKNRTGRPPRMLQWLVYEKGGVRYVVAHLHGIWIAENTKGDHPIRTEQSLEVRNFLDNLSRWYKSTHIVFGGDLNLALETAALALLLDGPGSDIIYQNLITTYGIASTRTEMYRKYGHRGESMHADYVLVSADVHVNQLRVMTNVLVSDHAPLIVSFS